MYVFQIMDWYCSTFSLMVLSLAECLVISWVYGIYILYSREFILEINISESGS